jgi:hypothetical protein
MTQKSSHRKRIVPLIPLVIAAILLYGGLLSAAVSVPAASMTDESGKIIETMNASGYTYLLIDSGAARTWVAIPETNVKVGDTVHYAKGMVMKGFHSKTLNRTFASVVFSPGLTDQAAGTEIQTASASPVGEKAAKSTPAADDSSFSAAVQAETKPEPAMETSGGSTGAIVPFAEIKVEKAEGENGRTVLEIFKQAKELDGKVVRLRGMVMKVNLNIMGKNWVHLQDGTGDPLTNTHDLVITTGETPSQGQTVTVEGTMRAAKDFGAGYSYAAIIEDAKIVN